MTVHLGTFDAERWWRPDDLATLPAVPDPGGDRLVDAMDQLLAVAGHAGDRLVTREPLSARHREALAAAGIEVDVVSLRATAAARVPVEEELLDAPGLLDLVAGQGTISPYAVLPATVRLAERLGVAGTLPTAEATARVNSKTWSSDLARRLGLPGAGAVVRSSAGLRAEVGRLGPAGAVVKDPFGVAGRGSLVLAAPTPRHRGTGASDGTGALDAVVRHLDRQVARGRRVELVVQPRYDRVADLSAHLDIGPGGRITWRGWQQARTRSHGYVGSDPVPTVMTVLVEGRWGAALEEVAAAVAAEGYRGPVCVDALVCRDGTVIPLLEINARRSLGSLNLLLGERVAGAGLRSSLRRRDLRWPVAGPGPGDRPPRTDRVIEAWARADLIARAGRPGLVPLALGDSGGARGRVWYALVATDAAAATALDAAAATALDEAGLVSEADRAA